MGQVLKRAFLTFSVFDCLGQKMPVPETTRGSSPPLKGMFRHTRCCSIQASAGLGVSCLSQRTVGSWAQLICWDQREGSVQGTQRGEGLPLSTGQRGRLQSGPTPCV